MIHYTSRYNFRSKIIDGKIYILGGSISSNITNSVDVYDPTANLWSSMDPMCESRLDFRIEEINGKIYAIGGRNNTSYLASLEECSILPSTPSAPANLTATAGNAQVALSWDIVTAATSYNVKRTTTTGGPYTTIAAGVTTNSYTDIDVVNGTTYYYAVSAVNTGGEGPDSNEASATPTAPQATGRALLVITMVNGLEKEYDLSMTEVEAFIDWYDARSAGTGNAYYIFNKTFNLGPFSSRKDYVAYDKIMNFEVMQYE